MELGLTIPLQRWLRYKHTIYSTQQDLRLCWDLHLLTPNGVSSLLAVHSSSRYAFVLYSMTAAEWAIFPELFLAELEHLLRTEGFTQGETRQYLLLAGDSVITKTHGRRPVAFLNRAVDDLYALPVGFSADTLSQPPVAQFLNEIPCRAAGHGEARSTARMFLQQDIRSLLAENEKK